MKSNTMAEMPEKETEKEKKSDDLVLPAPPKQEHSIEQSAQVGMKKGVKISLSIKLKHHWEKYFLEPFHKTFQWVETIFLIVCIFTVCVFLGATNGWLTFLFSISMYFLWQELYGQAREVATRLGKR